MPPRIESGSTPMDFFFGGGGAAQQKHGTADFFFDTAFGMWMDQTASRLACWPVHWSEVFHTLDTP